MERKKVDWLGRERYVPDLSPEELENRQSAALQAGMTFINEKKFPKPYVAPEDIADMELPKDLTGLSNEDLLSRMRDWTEPTYRDW